MNDSQDVPGGESGAASARPRRYFWAALPLVVVCIVGLFLFRGLDLKPREIPSVLIGKPVPQFDLPPIQGRPPGLKTDDLRGDVSLVNVFASWCVACRIEHPLFMELKEKADTPPIHGLNYKDDPDSATLWLKRFGDPYQRVGQDIDGRVGIDWGVYGVPETFLVDRQGQIVCKHIGPIQERDWVQKLEPAIAAARAGKPVSC